MEIINNSKGAGMRKRGHQQQQAPNQHHYEALKIERSYGCGAVSAPAAVCPHPVVPGLLAYSSGAVVVLYDSLHKHQTAFFQPPKQQTRRLTEPGRACAPYACIAFSRDGAYLAAGERGVSPNIYVWEASSGRCNQVLGGHKHGVGSIAFSSDGRLVSTGESLDGQVCVWNWQQPSLVVKQHTQAEVHRACVAEDIAVGASGITITTVGKGGHFKVWSLSTSRLHDGNVRTSLTPRPANLREYRSSDFVGVAAAPAEGPGPQAQALLYALTRSGVLLTIRPATRLIDKSVNLQVNAAHALAVSSTLVACACALGVVRLFAVRTLEFKGNLPRPSPSAVRTTVGGMAEPTNTSSESLGATPIASSAPASAAALFPDAVGCAFDCTGDRLTVVYADRSLMVWDVRNPGKVTRARSVLSHSGTVWGAVLIPTWQACLLGPAPPTPSTRARPAGEDAYGPSSVLCTCGADGTVRLWNVCLNNSASTAGPLGVPADAAGAARVTRTLRATLHAAPTPGLDPGLPGNGAGRRCNPDAPLPAPGAPGGGAPSTKPIVLRCLRVSPCGRHLATGDSRGNLRVYNLATLEQMLMREAHEAEILTLDYSPPSLDGSCFLASGSRDMLVHVYDMAQSYTLVGTCEAHLGAVTAVRFSAHGGRLALLSCSADKSVVFRLVQQGSCGLLFDIYHTERMAKGLLYDMAVDPASGRAVVVGQDSQIRLFDVATGRPISAFTGDPACGEAVSVVMDPSGHLAVCSCSDGSVAVYELDTGTLLARGSGHSDMCTGAVLLEDYRGLITVGGDGCALLWRLTPRIAQRMQEAAAHCRQQLEQQAAAQAEMVRQQQQAQERQGQREATTPGRRRRKAWNVADPSGGGSPDPMEVDEEPEPQQVQVDMSATIQRVKAGKPILSVEKLPRWAQMAFAREANSSGASATTTDTLPVPAADAPPQPAAVAPPLPAGKWAQRVLAEPPLQPPQPSQPTGASVAHVAGAATPPPASGLPAPDMAYSGASSMGTSSIAARTAAVTDQARPWADVLEEDDEIVFCDLHEEGQPPGAPEDAAVDAAEGCGSAGEAAAAVKGAVAGLGDMLFSPRDPAANGASASAGARGGHSARDDRYAGVREFDEQPQASDEANAKDDDGDDVMSGCASNFVHDRMDEEQEEEDIKCDLFREHFDSLRPQDQFSATKPLPPPDPRRMSLTYMYRQMRLSSGAGAGGDPAALSLKAAAAAVADGGSSAAQATAAAAGPPGAGTPALGRMPLPLTVNTQRGGTTALLTEQDGIVTGAAWTPERSMLPLLSPALAVKDAQMRELEKIRQRLLSTLRKRQTNDDAALGSFQPSQTAVLGPQNPPAPDAAEPSNPAALAPAATAPLANVPASTVPHPQAAADPAPATAAEAVAAAAADGQAREQTSYGGTFLLPPPPAYAPVGRHQRSGSITGATGDAAASSSFSALSNVSALMGQHLITPGFTSTGACDADGADPAARLFVMNPMYGTTPNTTPGVTVPSPRLLQHSDMRAVAQAAAEGGADSAASGAAARGGSGSGDALDAATAAAAGGGADVPAEVAAMASRLERRKTAEEVIRAMLELRSDGGAEEAGVCVITHDPHTAGGKAQQQQQEQRQPAAAAAVAVPGQQAAPQVRASNCRVNPALPSIRPNVDSPGRPVGPPRSTAASPARAEAAAPDPVTVAAAATAEELQGYAELLGRMQAMAREANAAIRRLDSLGATLGAESAGPSSAAATATAAAALAQAFREAARDTLAVLAVPPGPVTGGAGAIKGPAAGPGPDACPLVIACASPRVSLEPQAQSGRAQGASRLGPGNGAGAPTQAPARATAPVDSMGARGGSGSHSGALSGRGDEVTSSQVVVEMEMVESMVEEKLKQRLDAEMRRVEESMMKKIMQLQLAQPSPHQG